jgi:hypothetical protein
MAVAFAVFFSKDTLAAAVGLTAISFGPTEMQM